MSPLICSSTDAKMQVGTGRNVPCDSVESPSRCRLRCSALPILYLLAGDFCGLQNSFKKALPCHKGTKKMWIDRSCTHSKQDLLWTLMQAVDERWPLQTVEGRYNGKLRKQKQTRNASSCKEKNGKYTDYCNAFEAILEVKSVVLQFT